MSIFFAPQSAHSLEAVPKLEGRRKSTVPGIRSWKGSDRGELVCLTAYDYTMAALLDGANCVDLILVGDSVSGVVQGHSNTLPITLDEIIYHCRCVTRAVHNALVVGDMPFMTYQVSPEQALISAGRMMKEGGVAAVKLEGGAEIAGTVTRLVSAGIPVMGHVGLTPQAFHTLGGHVRQGKTAEQRKQILSDAAALADAGAFAVVLECIPADLAEEITATISCPTVGIGSGDKCDGQILVINDLLGLRIGRPPSFVNPVASMANDVIAAVKQFAARTQIVNCSADVAEGRVDGNPDDRVETSAV